MQPLIRAYVATANLVRDRVEAKRDNERGMAALEYLGMALVIAAIIGVLATQEIGDTIKTQIQNAIGQIMQAGGAGGGGN